MEPDQEHAALTAAARAQMQAPARTRVRAQDAPARVKAAHVSQLEQRDCGVACLAAVIRYHGGEARIERLRELSGTDRQGSTLLGLYQAGPGLGLETEALQADSLDEFKEYLDTNKGEPVILNILKDMRLMHYIVCYGYQNGRFLIGDPNPGDGLQYFTDAELEEVWQNKACLTARPTGRFVRSDEIRKARRNWMASLVKEDLNVLGIALFLGLALSVVGMATAVYSQKLIDDILPSGDTALLTLSLALLGFVIIVQSILGYLRSYLLTGQSRDFNNRITERFFGALLRLPKSFFDSRKVGEMVARLNDTARIQRTVQMLFTSVAISLLQAVAATVFLLVYSPGIGTVALCSIPIYFGLMYAFNKEIARRQRLVMHAYAFTESHYVDTIQGIATIKSRNREGMFLTMTKTIYGQMQELAFQLGKLGLRLGLIGGFAGAILNMVIVAWASFMVLDKSMEIGEMMAVIQITAMLLPAVQALAGVIIQLQEAAVAFDRMYEFASIPPEYSQASENGLTVPSDVNHLRLEGLRFRFAGRSELLKGIDMELRKGELVAIMGESGCGKSTLMQVLERFYAPTGGRIRVDGQLLEQLSVQGWRDLLGVVPQDIKLFNGTLLDNVTMGRSAGGHEADPGQLMAEFLAFCKEWGFDAHFEKLPQGLSTLLGEEGANISGGQRQLVGLARALYGKPKLLLLDEATSAMDRQTEAQVLDMLIARKSEFAILFVTHRLKPASRADRVYVIEQGGITAAGSHSDLMRTENFYSLSWKDLGVG